MHAARWRRPCAAGVFDGVPVPVKNCIRVKGYVLSSGSNLLLQLEKPSTFDTPGIARLRDAGAVIVGGVNMHELGMGSSGFNAHFGPARNPHHFNHFTGGSSSGSASLVAAGVVPVSIGWHGTGFAIDG